MTQIEKLRESYNELEKAQKEILKLIKQYELKDVDWYEERLLHSFYFYLKEQDIDISTAEPDQVVLDFIVSKLNQNSDWGRTWCETTIHLFKQRFNDKFGDMLDAKLAHAQRRNERND